MWNKVLLILFRNIFNILALIVILIILLGCTPRVVVDTVEVKVPVKCELPVRHRPVFDRSKMSNAEYLRDILIYAEQLERDLKFCNGK